MRHENAVATDGSLGGVNATRAARKVERNDLFPASEKSEIDIALLRQTLCGALHQASSDVCAARVGGHEDAADTCDRDLGVAHPNAAALPPDVADDVAISPRDQMDVMRRIAIGLR